MSEKPHRRLKLWQKAVEFVAELDRVTAAFPSAERYGLVSQLRRAAVSVPSNIAEGAAREPGRSISSFSTLRAAP